MWKPVGPVKQPSPASPALNWRRATRSLRIVGLLGSGGMGEVYRATDTNCIANVADQDAAARVCAPTRVACRFQTETRAISLSIIRTSALYDIGPNYLVMELVEGAILLDRSQSTPPSGTPARSSPASKPRTNKASPTATLNPRNIKVTPEAVVKILGFRAGQGHASTRIRKLRAIALAHDHGEGHDPGDGGLYVPRTGARPARRSPTDIWAFGVVFYELLTGKMLFGDGNNVADSLSAVLTREPDFTLCPKTLHRGCATSWNSASAKTRNAGSRTIGDARVLLDEAEPEAPNTGARPPLGSLGYWQEYSAVALLASAGPWLRPKTIDPGPGAARFLLPPPPGTSPRRPSWPLKRFPPPGWTSRGNYRTGQFLGKIGYVGSSVGFQSGTPAGQNGRSDVTVSGRRIRSNIGFFAEGAERIAVSVWERADDLRGLAHERWRKPGTRMASSCFANYGAGR